MRVLRALAEAAWADAHAQNLQPWLEAMQRLIDAGGSFNSYDVDRLVAADPAMAAAVAELVIADESLPTAERVDVTRRMRAGLPDAMGMPWAIVEARLSPSGSLEREYASAAVRRMADQCLDADPEASLSALVELLILESGAQASDPAAPSGTGLYEYADPRTNATLAIALRTIGDPASASTVAASAVAAVDSYEDWDSRAPTAAYTASLLVGMYPEMLIPQEGEHPARTAWRSAMSASLARDSREAEALLRNGRSEIGERSGEPGVRDAWLVGLLVGVDCADGEVAEVAGRALVEARCSGDVVVDDPNVAMAFYRPVDEFVRGDELKQDIVAQQELEATARCVDLMPTPANVAKLRMIARSEIGRSGIEAFRERLDLLCPEGLEDGKVGWNTVRAVAAELSAELAELSGEPSHAARAEVVSRLGAAVLFGSPDERELMRSAARAGRDHVSTAALQQLVCEGEVDLPPHAVARVDMFLAPEMGMDLDVPPERRLLGSAFVARAASLDAAEHDGSSGVPRRTWRRVEQALEELETRGEATGAKLHDDFVAGGVLEGDAEADLDVRMHVLRRYEKTRHPAGSIAEALRRGDGNASWPWTAGEALRAASRRGELSELREAVEREAASDDAAARDLATLLEDLAVPEVGPAPADETELDDLGDVRGERYPSRDLGALSSGPPVSRNVLDHPEEHLFDADHGLDGTEPEVEGPEPDDIGHDL